MTGFEYTAAYNLGNTVAYDASFQRCDADLLGGPFAAISTSTRGTFRPIYELAYAHYVTIKGLTMPYSLQIVSLRHCVMSLVEGRLLCFYAHRTDK